MNGVSAISSNDVWAAGTYVDSGIRYPLVEHWNGYIWTVISAAPVPGSDNEFSSIDALSDNDIWAVGVSDQNPGYSVRHTLAEHWNGSNWSLVASPNPGDQDNVLSGVAAIVANDAWAVGFYQIGNSVLPLTEHWNGSAWSAVPNPTPGPIYNYLRAVSATSSNDVWAVGDSFAESSAPGGVSFPDLIEHWNGTSWSIVSDPNPGFVTELDAVDAVSPTDAWIVGDDANATLTKHWNGTTWTTIPSPNEPNAKNFLYGVVVVSPSDVWAVGFYEDGSIYDHELIEHWNGSTWSIVPADDPPTGADLLGVARVTSTDLWAVGRPSGYSFQGITEHYSLQCISTPTPTPALTATLTTIATNTPLPTQTPGGPTATIEPSSTPTATPTFCDISFTDVPRTSTFYPYVECLACLGIVTGYPDGTFRPNRSVTRGQLAKIVSNSAGFNDPQTSQLFQDAPPGSTYFDFVGRLASRGYIGGYPCGGPGEPCGPGNLPYFRPNNIATRGQISKIDSNAAGFSNTPVGQQFQDVPVGSAYYTYTYRLANRFVMGGYPCGGPGEPCVMPLTLPYFQPNNNATRGQTSKIVSNTFFPDCNAPVR